MNELNQNELEITAAAYEELLVPALFQEWANRIVDSVDIQPNHNVLDVACGTGVLARTIVKRLDRSDSITGLDLNPGMLAIARRNAPNINWHQGKAEELPFEEESFDTVISQFGLMLFSSPKTALKEMYRVLKTGGHLIVAVFDTIQNMPAYGMMADLFERKVDKSVGEALRYPFSMGNIGELEVLFSGAGINNTIITTQKGTARFSSPRHMVLSDVKGWFPFAQIHLEDQTIDSIVNEAESVLDPFLTSDGAVQFDVSAHIIKAVKS